jgi:hypothetical protein
MKEWLIVAAIHAFAVIDRLALIVICRRRG